MKDFLVVPYTFTPGLSGVGSVALSIENFSINRLVALINTTRGIVLYASGDPSKLINSVSGNVLTLSVDTSTHSASDIIQIVYNTEQPLDVIANKTDETVGLLKILVDLLYSNAITDAGQRQRIVIDAITAGLTLAAVTTVSAVTNVAGIFGTDRQMYMDMLHMQYDSGIRGRITL